MTNYKLTYSYNIPEPMLIAAALRTGYQGDTSDIAAVFAHVSERFKAHIAPFIVTELDPTNIDQERVNAVKNTVTGTCELI